ncbi:MAG TPA: glutamine-hydrolyzing carbamoyl-phosphate synthase small subunit [Acidimicrobiales bacterium]|nr:glutamine-hydrolyzing carbamoyl-phosphate synthase small subunit [Acidimicrobiales bacterium]
MTITAAQLVLSDGEIFEGEAIGAVPENGITTGEVVFNTALSGYQEILTDPSYAGQIITFTYPHIGNYGVTELDDEASEPHCRGLIVRDLARRPSSWRSRGDLSEFLSAHGMAGIAGIDTRRLTRHIRDAGAMPGAFGTAPTEDLFASARHEPGTDNVDLAGVVSTKEPYLVGDGPRHVVAYDFGIKRSILRHLMPHAKVMVVPASTPAEAVLERKPDGVFLSNGPGDPAAVGYGVDAVRALVGRVPIMGICLGHQLLARALGGETYKLPFGHHGANHPVRRDRDGVVEITSQNHNYAVADGTVPDAEITHRNLNDGVVEGLRVADAQLFSVQYHPEAGPGPHDASYLFDDFVRLMDTGRTH